MAQFVVDMLGSGTEDDPYYPITSLTAYRVKSIDFVNAKMTIEELN